MLLVPEFAAPEDFVQLEGVEGSSIFAGRAGITWAHGRNCGDVVVNASKHEVGERRGCFLEEFGL